MKPRLLCTTPEKINIFKKYEKFRNIFINDIKDLFLSKYKKWNHEIILESEIKSTFGLIYLLSEKELTVLKNYLNENLKKEYIRLLKRRKVNPIELIIINRIPISQNNGFIKFEISFIFIKIY